MTKGKQKKLCGEHWRHKWEDSPEGRLICARCGKVSPVGVPPYIRFWDYVHKDADPDGCWMWTGSTQEDGYPHYTFTNPRKTIIAHRYAWVLVRGAIPDDLDLDHLCSNRGCVNPWHHQLLTRSENVRKAMRKPTCKKGHPWKKGSHRTHTDREGRTSRRCLICLRAKKKT